jgi:hypothetical protein
MMLSRIPSMLITVVLRELLFLFNAGVVPVS